MIVSILDEYSLGRLIKLAAGLGMDALVEIHSRSELKRALNAGADMIGINNRNLKTFAVNLSTTLQLVGDIPKDVIMVSESGIATREDIDRLEKAGVKAALVGETLVRSEDPCAKLLELQGRPAGKEVKVKCG